jgi:asparagine N-glycosylation enzyme membrane subunit Stt3
MGLIGSVKENQILTIIYGVFMVIFAIVNFSTRGYWAGVIDIIVGALAFWFVYLIKQEVTGRNYA